MQRYNAKIVNIDSTVVLQKPKVMPYIEKMRQNIAFALECDVSRVNVKATTEEHLGFTGREEGVSAHSVVLLEIKNKAPHLI
jgi:2-C-methyl-D-erythritol 2,4-cyclodiphosphate synthase